MENENLITQEKIFELYGDYLLNHGERPKNIYRFARENKFEEIDFYNHFSSFEQIEKLILVNLFNKSVELASEVNNSDEVISKEKLLNVYFIFFENMTMNRSLILMILYNFGLSLLALFHSVDPEIIANNLLGQCPTDLCYPNQ